MVTVTTEPRLLCPRCDPGFDSERDVVDWCNEHIPRPTGPDDTRVQGVQYVSGMSESGGETNRRMCNGLHRGQWD